MSHPKRPRDPNQLAKSIIGIAAFNSVDSACRRRRWRELVWLVVFVFLFGAALLANVSDRPLAEHRGMWVTQALR